MVVVEVVEVVGAGPYNAVTANLLGVPPQGSPNTELVAGIENDDLPNAYSSTI